MPTNYKILGQLALSANTASVVYTVPANTQAIVSCILIHNISSNDASVWVVKSGQSQSNSNLIISSMTSFDTRGNYIFDSPVTLGPGDKIVGGQGNYGGNLVFHVFGVEIS